jgi:hypothetical protein
MQTVKIKWIANPAGFMHAYSIGDVCDMETKKAELLAQVGAIEIIEAAPETATAKPKAETATAKPQRKR